MSEHMPMRLGLVIATHRRPEIIAPLLGMIGRQSVQPDYIVLSVVDDSDLPVSKDVGLSTIVLRGPAGSCVQRNRGIDFLHDRADVVVFLDDDFWMAPDYLETVQNVFSSNPDVVAVTGNVIADGATSEGFSIDEADAMLQQYRSNRKDAEHPKVVPVEDTYGCNMAFRERSIGDVRFDEKLPLYGWQEDVDFSAQLRARGRIVKVERAVGVHLGTKRGKTSGMRFGYSQVVNPIYIVFKGNMRFGRALVLITKNILANLAGSISPEPFIDRRGRLRGNLTGIRDLLLGRLDPSRILRL
ncbi:MAG: glycosyltransferase [Xanthobacteraceae bacterium]|nr:glycosyltransferase [Xanthobacteraceae bacterium]